MKTDTLLIGVNGHPASETFLSPVIGIAGRSDVIAVFPSEECNDAAYVRLFAAAPLLLAACKALVKTAWIVPDTGCWFCKSERGATHDVDCPIAATMAAIALAEPAEK